MRTLGLFSAILFVSYLFTTSIYYMVFPKEHYKERYDSAMVANKKIMEQARKNNTIILKAQEICKGDSLQTLLYW